MRNVLFILPFIFASCQGESEPIVIESDGDDPLGSLEMEYAQHLRIDKDASNYIIQILDPETGKADRSYTIDPSKEMNIIGLTATLNGMLSILESTDQLVGISDINYVYDPKIKQRHEQGLIGEFGDESSHSLEKIIASQGNTILYSGFGDQFPNEDKLNKLGFAIIPIYDWRENHPLGKAEWIKMVGVMIGKEQEAIHFFEQVKQEYHKLEALTSELKNRPTVVSGNLLGDIWYSPGGDSFMAKMIADAGGDYRYKDETGTGSIMHSIEKILNENQETEFWINPGIGTKAQIDKINPHGKHLKSYNNMYCYSPNMNKFWERSAAEPHLMLSDLIHIFHPEIEAIQSLYFYQKID